MTKTYIFENKEDMPIMISYFKNIGIDITNETIKFENDGIFPRSIIFDDNYLAVCYDCRNCTIKSCEYKNYIVDTTNIFRKEKLKRILYV